MPTVESPVSLASEESSHTKATKEFVQDVPLIDPLIAEQIEQDSPDQLSFPAGMNDFTVAYKVLQGVIIRRRAAEDVAIEASNKDQSEKGFLRRNDTAVAKLADRQVKVDQLIEQHAPSAIMPTNQQLAADMKGMRRTGTPVEVLRRQVFDAHARQHLPELTAIVLSFVSGDNRHANQMAFEEELNEYGTSTIIFDRQELWEAIAQARQENPTAESTSETTEPDNLSPDEEPVTPEYAVTDFATLGVVMGRLLREYTTDPARAEDFPTDAEVAAAYEEEGLPPLRPRVLTTAVRQAHEEIREERARLARIAEREALRQAEEAVEIIPEPTAIEQARVTVVPELIAVEHPVGRPFFRLALNRADIMLTPEEEDELYAELRAARGEEPEEVVADIPSEDDVIADVMGEYFGDGVVPEIEELRERFAERGVPQAEADLVQLHGAIADMVTEEQDRVAAAAEAQRIQEAAEAHERAERLQEQAVAAILAARDWMHPSATQGDRGTTLQDIVAYQRITEDGDDGIDTALAGQNVFAQVLEDEEYQDLTIDQRRQVLREVGDRLRHDFRTAQQDAELAYEDLNLAEERAQNAQQQLDASRIAPVNPLIESNDTTLYQPDTSAADLDRKAALLRENIKQKSQLAAEKTKAGLQKAKTKVQEASQTVKSELSSDKNSSESGLVGRFLDKIFRINPDKREKYDL